MISDLINKINNLQVNKCQLTQLNIFLGKDYIKILLGGEFYIVKRD